MDCPSHRGFLPDMGARHRTAPRLRARRVDRRAAERPFRFGWQHVDKDGGLTYRQTKTGGEVTIPLTAALPAGFEADDAHLMAALELARGRMLFLETAKGAARSDKAFSAWIAGASSKAGLEGLSPHGWRKYRLTDLGERLGSTPHQIMAWSGHRTLKEVDGHTRGAHRRRMIEAAGNQRGANALPTRPKRPEKTGSQLEGGGWGGIVETATQPTT